MTAIMRVLGWKAKGFRCPDHEIECCDVDGKPYGISLIQMPNGTGKTTTLTLLRAAFSGAAEGRRWRPELVRELRKRDCNIGEGIFELRLVLNEKLLTIRMEFDFEEARVDYKTTWGSGQKSGFHPPFELRRFMNEDFVNFYVFDGELAERLLDRSYTNAEEAVESLFQVHLLHRMSGRVSEYWDDMTSRVTAKDDLGYRRRKNKLAEWRKRYDVLVNSKEKLEHDLAEISTQLSRQEQNYREKIAKAESRSREINQARDTVRDLKENTDATTMLLLDQVREPQALSATFATSILELKSGLDRVKLPESAAREFFEELAVEEDCVCGRPIDADVREVIRNRARQYLGSDDVTLLNAMKSAISDVLGDTGVQSGELLNGTLEEVDRLVGKLQSARNELDELELAAGQADPQVKNARDKIEALKARQEKLEITLGVFNRKDEKVRMDRLNSEDPERIFSIPTVMEGIGRLEDRVAEASETQTQRQKRDVLQRVIGDAHERAKNSIKMEVQKEANDRIEELMPHNNIRIGEINGCLVLQGQSGGSVGETLSVGYAFLSTLFHRANQHQLPFIVDSPANPIDYDIRSNIGELVPRLTGQFVAFMISSEREKFLASLKKARNGNIQYVTVFRKGVRHLEARAIESNSCVTTIDGYRVTGEQFFNEFQLDNEEI